MMASVMNSVLLQASLEKIGVETRVQTALMIQEVAEPYVRRRAIRHLEKGRVVIFGGIGAGIGNPLFTTDTAAALRASEINADVVLKGIVGDDEYGCPPRGNSNTPFEHISFRKLAARGFSRMDMTAVTCCEENNIPDKRLVHPKTEVDGTQQLTVSSIFIKEQDKTRTEEMKAVELWIFRYFPAAF
ncbi:hypothetical protein C2845_PM16G06720 [Panicum miliaceum]|uniref:UMP kinase n=1 Tax=Panicum miliaceum TaxID=4540 RepID=A0A3L6PVP3_PANMI|nr:hypothetical protein C2845_PM16G06720 [Panicum miliaceum]